MKTHKLRYRISFDDKDFLSDQFAWSDTLKLHPLSEPADNIHNSAVFWRVSRTEEEFLINDHPDKGTFCRTAIL